MIEQRGRNREEILDTDGFERFHRFANIGQIRFTSERRSHENLAQIVGWYISQPPSESRVPHRDSMELTGHRLEQLRRFAPRVSARRGNEPDADDSFVEHLGVVDDEATEHHATHRVARNHHIGEVEIFQKRHNRTRPGADGWPMTTGAGIAVSQQVDRNHPRVLSEYMLVMPDVSPKRDPVKEHQGWAAAVFGDMEDPTIRSFDVVSGPRSRFEPARRIRIRTQTSSGHSFRPGSDDEPGRQTQPIHEPT